MNSIPPSEAGHQTGRFEPGRNCWRIARAEKARLIVDADDYFRAARKAMLEAEQRIMLIGWDFDTRIHLDETHGDGDAPTRIGDFILWLSKRRPELDIYILRWDIGALKTLVRGSTPFTVARWAMHERIHLRLDGAHPTGASHHQKIVVIDDCLAFCGGIDMTGGRWDTRDHSDHDPRRLWPGGGESTPWHDATMVISGPAAAALGQVTRDRWTRAGGEEMATIEREGSCWPKGLEPQFRDIDVAVSRTLPELGEEEAHHEIEALYIDLIARARRTIYAESQYFASRRIAEAIAARLEEPDGPEIVLINPVGADGWLESEAMDSARARLHEALMRLPGARRFRIYHPVTARGAPIYVHAKIMVVDEEVLRVGSSNWNNRSMRLDTECDVTIDAAGPGEEERRETIRQIRDDLLAEHLGVAPERMSAGIADAGSLIGAIERLRGGGRSLRSYAPKKPNEIETWLADHEVFDPEGPSAMFEPFAHRSLFRRMLLPWRG